MSFQAKRELLARVAPRYREAGREQKSVILDEFIVSTGVMRIMLAGALARLDQNSKQTVDELLQM